LYQGASRIFVVAFLYKAEDLPMIKTILVPATGSDSDLPVFGSALSIARLFGAHIDALHAHLDPVEVAVRLTSDTAGTPLVGGMIERLEEDFRAREERAKRLFENFCSGEGIALLDASTTASKNLTAEWHVQTGDEARLISVFGMTADLIVAGRGAEDNAGARSVLEAALLDTGRPLLISTSSPAPPVQGGTIAIAWKPTPQAAHAVMAAMPLLGVANRIIVVSVAEGADRSGGEALARNLRRHGLRVEVEQIGADDQDPADALLAWTEGKAGLLVMGGYGHSRFREWVFGGFTRRVLTDAPLPVLMMH
jgi:nucleotide-binding universal stress UspA family protein